MIVEIKRGPDDPHSVPSQVFVNGAFQCYGLEPARTNPVHEGHPCISAGTFKVVATKSPHLHYTTPEVLDVPGRTAIRWHIANFPRDVLGCLGVGNTRNVDFVGQSANAFQELMKVLGVAWDAGEEVTAIYTDPKVAAGAPAKE
jgi:Family of unknown function (DUF5675)